MGGAVGALVGGGGPLGAVVGGGTGGVNKLLSPLGLGGEQGESFQAGNGNMALAQLNQGNDVFNNKAAMEALESYGAGDRSLKDVMHLGSEGTNDMTYLNQLATGATTGSRFATDQVQNNSILGQLYGKGGTLEDTVNKQKELQNQGYKLTPEDREAYGQASGDIARQFGSQQQGLAQSLADRGLSAGSSGAAGVGFTGLAGSQSEQLAKAQTDIADRRMQNTMARLGQNEQFLNQMSGGAETAINDQYGRQLAGAQNYQKNLQDTANTQIAQNSSANQSNLAAMQDKRGAAGKTIFGAVGQGLYNGVAGGGAKATSGAIGGLSGGAGAAGAA